MAPSGFDYYNQPTLCTIAISPYPIGYVRPIILVGEIDTYIVNKGDAYMKGYGEFLLPKYNEPFIAGAIKPPTIIY